MNQPLHTITGCEPENLSQQSLLPAFSEQALMFLYALSESLLNNPDCRAYPNLVALGFWLRPTSLQKMIDDYCHVPAGHRQCPAGVVFHITPANIDNLFIYSWAISLLCGNSNIIRISSKESDERLILVSVVDQLLRQPQHEDIRQRTAIVFYGHDDDSTIALSSLAARRVIWGSDETIAHLRTLPVPPLCQDVAFPDRRSAALLSATSVLTTESLDSLWENFYRDTYGFNQMACSSPRLLVWLKDDDVGMARDIFWNGFNQYVLKKNPMLVPAELMDKRVAVQSIAMTADVNIRNLDDARLQVVELDRPDARIEAEHPGGGLFLDTTVNELMHLHECLGTDHQTLTYWGLAANSLNQFAAQSAQPLADRIVPVGQALNFNPIWDSMNLFERLSRQVKAA